MLFKLCQIRKLYKMFFHASKLCLISLIIQLVVSLAVAFTSSMVKALDTVPFPRPSRGGGGGRQGRRG